MPALQLPLQTPPLSREVSEHMLQLTPAPTAWCYRGLHAEAAAVMMVCLQVIKNKIRGVNMKGFGYGGEDAYFYASGQ